MSNDNADMECNAGATMLTWHADTGYSRVEIVDTGVSVSALHADSVTRHQHIMRT